MYPVSSPEDCLVDCAHLFLDRDRENSYGNLLYRITITRIEMLVFQRAHEAAIKAMRESHARVITLLGERTPLETTND